jgi:hypothetical protein
MTADGELDHALDRARVSGLRVAVTNAVEVACPRCHASLTLPVSPTSPALAASRTAVFTYCHTASVGTPCTFDPVASDLHEHQTA